MDLTIEEVKWTFLNDDLHPDISKIKFIKRRGVGQCLVGPFEFKIYCSSENTQVRKSYEESSSYNFNELDAKSRL